jgi:hypothetical protein
MPQGAWRRDELIGGKPLVVKYLWLNSELWLSHLRVAVVRNEKLIADTGGQFRNPEEEQRSPLEAATKQRLLKAEKTLCVL